MRLFAALALCLACALTLAAEHGTIRVCRRPGVVSASDHKPIELATATEFVTPVNPDETSRHPKQIKVATVAPATIAATAKCVTVAADLLLNTTNEPVKQKTEYLVFSGSSGPEVVAYIASDFM